jgi:hypothetical protein
MRAVITWRISDKEPFPSDADVPVKSRTSSINWNARPCNDIELIKLLQVHRIYIKGK